MLRITERIINCKDCLVLSNPFIFTAPAFADIKTLRISHNQWFIIQEIEDGMVTVNYIRSLNIDEPLARLDWMGGVRFYHTDALGSVIALTDELGEVKTQYNYTPFGTVEVIGEESDNPFQYTGRENDGTGLMYYRARYYSPEMKRFISEDPIGFGGGINFYSYVKNNPANGVDPSGKVENIGDAMGSLLSVVNEYLAKFRDIKQVERLYLDTKAMAYQYECGLRVPVTVFLEREGPYYNYKEIKEGHDFFWNDCEGEVAVKDILIGHKGCEDLPREFEYPYIVNPR